MNDQARTNQELLEENSALKRRVKELEHSESEIKRAEDALRESEGRYRSLFENASIGIFHSLPEGKFLRVNSALAQMFRYGSPAEMVSAIANISTQIYVDSQKHSTLVAKTSQQTDWVYAENRYRRKDGTILTANLTVRKVLNPDGTLAYLEGFVQDITERKQAEEALKESRRNIIEALEFNKTILNTSSIGILTYKDSGQCTYANAAAVKIGGTSEAGLLEQNFHQIESWKKSGMYESALKALRTGSEQQIETYVTTTFGKDVWLSLRFSSFYSEGENNLLVFTSDITERKRAEEELLGKSKALEELNTALRVLIGHYKNDQRELEERIASNVGGRIIPYVEKLKQSRLDIGQSALLEIIESSFRDISSPFLKSISSEQFRFTPKEIEIVSLIKEGKTTKEIAKILCIGKRTVDSYRDNIRGKLDLANKKVNLRTYLLSIHNT